MFLMEYIRGKKNKRVGVVVAVGKDKLGYSLCHIPLDTFDRYTGFELAFAMCMRQPIDVTKIVHGSDGNWYVVTDTSSIPIPRSAVKPLLKMADRARRYYKGG